MLKVIPAFAKSSLQSKWLSSSRFITSSTALRGKTDSTIDESDFFRTETCARLANTWWDENGPLRSLHTFNRIRVPFITRDLPNPGTQALENYKVLEVGCGGGVLSEAIAKCGVEVTGIDANKQLIDIATNHSNTNQELKIKPTYHFTTIEEHAIEHQNYYDRIVASEVIEHVKNQDLFVKSCVQALKPGGTIIFTCPSKTRISQFVYIVLAEDILQVIPKGAHYYEKFLTPRDLRLMFESNKCRVVEVKGYSYNLITDNWKWTRTLNHFFATRAVKLE